MTITIRPELEKKLRAKASRDGRDLNAVAESLLESALDWEARDREEAIAGIRRGLTSSDAGRVRPAAEVIADLRAKLPPTAE